MKPPTKAIPQETPSDIASRALCPQVAWNGSTLHVDACGQSLAPTSPTCNQWMEVNVRAHTCTLYLWTCRCIWCICDCMYTVCCIHFSHLDLGQSMLCHFQCLVFGPNLQVPAPRYSASDTPSMVSTWLEHRVGSPKVLTAQCWPPSPWVAVSFYLFVSVSTKLSNAELSPTPGNTSSKNIRHWSSV